MRIAGDVFNHSCHSQIAVGAEVQGFSQSIFVTENLFGHISGQNYRTGIFEGCGRVPLDKLMSKDFKKIFIHIKDVPFVKIVIGMLDEACSLPQPCVCANSWQFCRERRSRWKGRKGIVVKSTTYFFSIGDPVDTIRILIISVIAQFILNPQQDEDAAGHPNG